MLSILSLEIGGSALAIGALFLLGLLVGMITFLRFWFAKNSNALPLNPKVGSEDSFEHRNKYIQADVFRLRGTFLNVGRVFALLLTVMAFAWTTYDKKVDVSKYIETLQDEIEIDPPRTAEPPPPVLPPPPPVIQEVPDETVIEEQPEFVSNEINEQTAVIAPVQVKAEVPPTPKPEPIKEAEPDEIFRVVEEMPRFPGCEDLATADEKKKCADKKMLEFIYKNIKYPAIARENGVEGTAVVTFVVEKDGTVTDAKVVRDIGAQCGQESLRVVNLMNETGIKWLPGKQRGRAVRVQFNLPVRFALE